MTPESNVEFTAIWTISSSQQTKRFNNKLYCGCGCGCSIWESGTASAVVAVLVLVVAVAVSEKKNGKQWLIKAKTLSKERKNFRKQRNPDSLK